MSELNNMVNDFQTALLQINRLKAVDMFSKFYENNQSIHQLEDLIIHSLEKIGYGWEKGKVSLSQVYMSGIICEELMDKHLKQLNAAKRDVPKIAIGVLLDHHALGKRIVYSVLCSGGYDVMDLGQGLTVDEMVNKTLENNIEILLISTLMLPSALKVKEVADKLRDKQFHGKIIVGGAPFRLDSSLWQTVKADADGKAASDIIGIIASLPKGGN